MSTYYQYREVGVMIAHKLMSMEGWKVYGYHADESDSMTDYYSPAHWGGVAEKNGYILCVNVYGASKEQEITRYNKNYVAMDEKTKETIKKLEAITTDRGASEHEEKTAQEKIELLTNKNTANNANVSQYEVIGTIPAHMAHPPKCNWHIEKDGVIIEKGNGILKYSDIDNYYSYSRYMEDMNAYKKDKKSYFEKHVNDLMYNPRYNNYTDREKAEHAAKSHIEELEKDIKLMKRFEEFINKIDTTCGGILGSGDLVTYEKIIKTEYKTENKAVITESGEIVEGQCIILNCGFTHGSFKGTIYRIKKTAYGTLQGIKLNGKLTKECTGKADSGNRFNFGTAETLQKWIDKGSISFCTITEVKTPYEVEKIVKKVIKAETDEKKATPEKKTTTITEEPETSEVIELNNLHFEITEDTDTRDDSIIYVVKAIEKLTREEYIKLNQYIKSTGGYYSRFKHGFIFKDNPIELLNGEITQQESKTESDPQHKEYKTKEQPPEEKKQIDFEIEQKDKIWLVKIKDNLPKEKFAEVKRNFAILKGFYSSFNNSFIFKYDPTEKIKQTA